MSRRGWTAIALEPPWQPRPRQAHARTSPIFGSVPSPTQHEVLQNLFKSPLHFKDRVASLCTSAVMLGAAAEKLGATRLRTSGAYTTGCGGSGMGVRGRMRVGDG